MTNNINRFLRFKIILIYLLVIYVLSSCSEKKEETIKDGEAVTILVQPFKDINSGDVAEVVKEIRKLYPKVKILEPVDLPTKSYYKPRNRYRADSIISFLSKNTRKGFVTIGLTTKDISTTKGNIKDFGIMGLGFRPGTACVASSFRLDKNKSMNNCLKLQYMNLDIHRG